MAKGYNPLAPRNPKQLQRVARQAVSAQISPLIAALNADFDRRSRSGMAALQGYGQQLQSRLAPLQAQTQANYGQAQSQQAAVDASLQQSLSGAGSSLAQGLSKQFGAAGIPQGAGGDLAAMGLGAGNAAYAKGSASLSQLLSQGAAASNYAGSLPGIAAIGSQQAGSRYTTQLESQRGEQLANLRSKIPGLVQNELGTLQNLEFQKSVANLGFGEKQQKLAIDQQTKAQESKRPDSSLSKTYGYVVDKNGNPVLQNGKKIPVAKTGAASKQKSANDKRTKAFYTVRDRTFSEAKRLYKTKGAGGSSGSDNPFAPTTKGGSGPGVTYEKAYKNLWTHYGTQLVSEYGYKRKAVDTMIRRALKTAGYQNPGAQKKAAAAGAAGAAAAVGGIGL